MFIANSLYKNFFNHNHPYVERALRCTPILGFFMRKACLAHDRKSVDSGKLSTLSLYKRSAEHFKYSHISEVLCVIAGCALLFLGNPVVYIGIALIVISLILLAISTFEQKSHKNKYKLTQKSKKEEVMDAIDQDLQAVIQKSPIELD